MFFAPGPARERHGRAERLRSVRGRVSCGRDYEFAVKDYESASLCTLRCFATSMPYFAFNVSPGVFIAISVSRGICVGAVSHAPRNSLRHAEGEVRNASAKW